MAEGGTSISSKSDKENDLDAITCSICMEIYTDPRALPCLHTFCYTCLNNIIENTTLGYGKKLPCPLCKEKHVFDREMKASTFRQDFRIKNMIDKLQDAANLGKSDSDKISGYDPCNIHSDFPLRYFCNNAGCEKPICETCWDDKHENHSVVLLSKGLSRRKDCIMENIRECKTEIQRLLNDLPKSKEDISQKTDVSEKLIDAELQRVRSLEKNLLELKERVTSNATTEHDKMDLLIESLENMHASLAKIDCTAKNTLSVSKLDALERDIKTIITEVNDVSSCPMTFEPDLPVLSLDNKLGYFVWGDYTIKGNIGFKSPGDIYRDKIQSLYKDTNKSIGNVTSSYSNQCDKGCTCSKCSTPQGTVTNTSVTRGHKQVSLIHEQRWQLKGYTGEHGLCASVKSGRLIFLADDFSVTGYDIFTGNIINSFNFCGDDGLDDIGSVVIKNEEHLVQLVRSKGELRFSYMPKPNRSAYDEVIFTWVVNHEPLFMSCAYDNIAYSHYGQDGYGLDEVYITCLDVSNAPYESVSAFNTGLMDHGAICLKKSWNYFRLAVTNLKSLDQSRHTDALRTFHKDGSIAWTLSYNDLDPDAERYDLRHMTTDREYFYVLNSASGAVHVVASHGQKMHKVLSGLEQPMLLAYNSPSRRLCVVSKHKILDVYRVVKK